MRLSGCRDWSIAKLGVRTEESSEESGVVFGCALAKRFWKRSKLLCGKVSGQRQQEMIAGMAIMIKKTWGPVG
jgi:hypothetical protein